MTRIGERSMRVRSPMKFQPLSPSRLSQMAFVSKLNKLTYERLPMLHSRLEEIGVKLLVSGDEWLLELDGTDKKDESIRLITDFHAETNRLATAQ